MRIQGPSTSTLLLRSKQPSASVSAPVLFEANRHKSTRSNLIQAGLAFLFTLGAAFSAAGPGKPVSANSGVEQPPVTVASTQAATAVEFPLEGTYKLGDLLDAYGIDPFETILPEIQQSLAEFLDKAGIDWQTEPITVQPGETVDERLGRNEIDLSQPITFDSPEMMKKLIVATLESYFRLHADEVPTENLNPNLSASDRFINDLFRTALGHDLYVPSMTTGELKPVADGSVLAETAFAPDETGNARLIRSKDDLASILGMIGLDAMDGRVNGKELLVKSAHFLDMALGTAYTPAVSAFTPEDTAVVSLDALRGPAINPFAPGGFEALSVAMDNMPVRTFTRANVVFHALTQGGPVTAQADTEKPSLVTSWNRQEAENALGNQPLSPLDFGFISRFAIPESVQEEHVRPDLEAMQASNNAVDPFLNGDETAGGTRGPDSYLDYVFFDGFGVPSQVLREGGQLTDPTAPPPPPPEPNPQEERIYMPLVVR